MHFRIRTVLIVVTAASLAGWLGYRRGYVEAAAAVPQENNTSVRERRSRPADTRTGSGETLRKLLGRPVNARTSAEAWDIISRYSIRQIKEALADLPRGESGAAASSQEAMLYFCWAQIDPLEALEAAGKVAAADEQKQWLPATPFTAWMKDDPDSAYQWAMNAPGFNKNMAHHQMARHLTGLPPDEGWARAKTFDLAVRSSYLGRVAGTMAHTAEGRQEFLAMIARNGCSPEESSAGMESLMRIWGGTEPAATLAGLRDLPVDDGAREQARRVTTEYWIQSNPAAVIEWMSSGENPQPVGNQVDIYRQWAEHAPKDASAQFEQLSRQSPGFREGVMKSLLTSYYQGGWIPFGRTANSDGPIFSRLKIHYDQWAANDPQQASAWIGTLDPALQQRLTTPATHETR